MLLCVTGVFAQSWNDQTRDAAYEAPLKKFTKKWYSNDGQIWEFLPNNLFKVTVKQKLDGLGYTITMSGNYNRNKDRLTTTITSYRVVGDPSDLAKLSARSRDEFQAKLKNAEQVLNREDKNKKSICLLLRLDDDCLIMSSAYDPDTQYFDKSSWDTFYSKSKEERDAIAAAERKARQEREAAERKVREERAAAEKARQDSIAREEERLKQENSEAARAQRKKERLAKEAESTNFDIELNTLDDVLNGLVKRMKDENIEYFSLREKDPSLKEYYKLFRKLCRMKNYMSPTQQDRFTNIISSKKTFNFDEELKALENETNKIIKKANDEGQTFINLLTSTECIDFITLATQLNDMKSFMSPAQQERFTNTVSLLKGILKPWPLTEL